MLQNRTLRSHKDVNLPCQGRAEAIKARLSWFGKFVSPHNDHVRKGHPKQRTVTLCHSRRHGCARQPRPQLFIQMEWRAEPRLAGDPAQSSDRRSVTRPIALGPHSLLCGDPKGGRKPINAKVRRCARYQPFAMPMRDDAASFRLMASPSGRRLRAKKQSSPMLSP